MKLTDPIGDLFTRIRNALAVKQDYVLIPHSNLKESIIQILIQEGFLDSYSIIEKGPKKTIKGVLKYNDQGKSVLSGIERISKPGNRVFVRKGEIPKIWQGFGICVLSTSLGVITGREARKQNTGGELLGKVY